MLRALAVAGDRLRVMDQTVDLCTVTRLLVVGAGKAAASMAAAAEEILGDRLTGGTVNTKYGHALPLQRLGVVECGHPVPDQAGVDGTEAILAVLAALDAQAVVVCLLSGGGSALMPAPALGLTLADKQATTQLLLACGATIGEINTIRKHLSRVKGGQLARHAQPARVFTLALSDVIGDPLDTIASGPTYPDPTTFADCQGIVDRYGLTGSLPAPVRHRLAAGACGQIADTPKPGDACFARTANGVVGNNALAVAAAEAEARALGYSPLVLTTRLQGEAREVAAVVAAVALEVQATDRPVARPACLIWGGETTVTLRGDGQGGRNQELALAAAMHLDGAPDVLLLCGGTDGTDGPTDAAGAVADGYTIGRSRLAGLSAAGYLARNDSYAFFRTLDDLVVTGPTHTNVMDLQICLVG
jgi:glycerate 2-kinase